jgi:hypothetical protein
MGKTPKRRLLGLGAVQRDETSSARERGQQMDSPQLSSTEAATRATALAAGPTCIDEIIRHKRRE